MEVKVLCACGSKYAFEVEPVDGRMPRAIGCPVCGADGTDAANEKISEKMAAIGAPAPLAAQTAVAEITPVATLPAPRIRLNVAKPAATVAPSPESTPAALPEESFASRPQVGRPTPVQTPTREPNFGLGFVGAFLGAALAVGIWLGLFYGTGSRLKIAALAVGYLVGMGAKLLSRDEGSNELGLLAGLLTFVSIFGAQYWMAREQTIGAMNRAVVTLYEARAEDARQTLKEMPNESDSEIREHLASLSTTEDGEKVPPASISNEKVRSFRETELPELKTFASGKTSLADFKKTLHTDEIEENGGVKLFLVVQGLGVFSWALMIASVGLSYKIVANA